MEECENVTEGIEQAAWRDMVEGTPAPVRERLRLSAEGRAGALILRSNTNSPVLNRAVGLGCGRPATEQDVQEMAAAFREVGATQYLVQLSRLAQPPRIVQWLEAEGLARYRRAWVKLLRDDAKLGPPPPTTVQIVPATPAHAGPLGAILAAAFDAPEEAGPVFTSTIGRRDWHTYVALDEGRITGGGTLFTRGPHAYLAYSATAPEDRCRGVQRGLMHARLAAALSCGVKLIATETGEWREDETNHSYKNMIRFGFRVACIRENWAPAGMLWQHGTPRTAPAATPSR